MGWIEKLFGSASASLTGSENATEAQKIVRLVTHYVDKQGGLANVVKQFEQSGFDYKVHSWVSTGPNCSINSVEVLQLLGLGALSEMAKEVEIPVDRLRDLLAQYLPHAIDKATPYGKV